MSLNFFPIIMLRIFMIRIAHTELDGHARNFCDLQKSAARILLYVQNVFCANDLRPMCNRIQCPRFFWFRITTRLPMVDRTAPSDGAPFPLCRWSILISRLVSRKLNHCTIDRNNGSLLLYIHAVQNSRHAFPLPPFPPPQQRWFNDPSSIFLLTFLQRTRGIDFYIIDNIYK